MKGPLDDCRLMLGLPTHNGECHYTHARGLADLGAIAGKIGFPIEYFFLPGLSLITRARNSIAHAFMKTDCTHLMFIDSDIGFNGLDVFELLCLQGQNPEYDIIGAAYRLKAESGYYAVRYFADTIPESGQVIAVRGLATGFMLIRRSVFERLAKVSETYRPSPSFGVDDPDDIMVEYFRTVIDPVSREYLGEDYAFCKACAELGIRTWMVPYIKLSHAGTYLFS